MLLLQTRDCSPQHAAARWHQQGNHQAAGRLDDGSAAAGATERWTHAAAGEGPRDVSVVRTAMQLVNQQLARKHCCAMLILPDA